MSKPTGERGFGLILLLAIIATLSVLAATSVVVVANTRKSTYDQGSRLTALDYAEAALNSGVLAVRTQSWPAANGSFSASSLATAYTTTYSSGPTPTITVYDNQGTVDKTVTWDKGSSTSAATPDGKLWVQASVTYSGQTAVVREMVGQVNNTGSLSLPAAAIYTDGNVTFTSGGGNAFGITSTGAPDTGKSASIIAGGKFTGNWSTTLSPTGGAATLAMKTNGTVYNPKLGINPAVAGTGGVAPLNTVMTPAVVATLTSQAKQGNVQPPSGYTVVSASTIQNNSTYAASGNVEVDGDLSLSYGNRTFHGLYVKNGNLTQNGGGTFQSTSLYVGKTLTITSTSGTIQMGPTYVGGDFVIGGGPLSINTTDYTNSATAPAPLYVAGLLNEQGGPFTPSWGPTYVAGNVTFAGNSAAIMCPLLVTPGVVTTQGSGSLRDGGEAHACSSAWPAPRRTPCSSAQMPCSPGWWSTWTAE